MVLTGDALLVGAAGRPDLHAQGELTVEEMARSLYRSITERCCAADHLLLYPGHYAGSVCGAGLSAMRHRPSGSSDATMKRSRFRGRVRLQLIERILAAPNTSEIVAAN